jgi:hypothetical protein
MYGIIGNLKGGSVADPLHGRYESAPRRYAPEKRADGGGQRQSSRNRTCPSRAQGWVRSDPGPTLTSPSGVFLAAEAAGVLFYINEPSGITGLAVSVDESI